MRWRGRASTTSGPRTSRSGPVLAVTGRTNPISGKPPSRWTWRLLVNEVRRAKEPRVVLSSEFLADARPDAIRTIVGDLGAEQVHVVVTLRPLARIVPSQWQQFVQSGLRQSYDDWLDVMFKGPPPTPIADLLVSPSPRRADRPLGGCRRPGTGHRRRARRRGPRHGPARLRAADRPRERHAGRRSRPLQPIDDHARDRGRPRIQPAGHGGGSQRAAAGQGHAPSARPRT